MKSILLIPLLMVIGCSSFCYAEADGKYYKDAVVVTKLVPDENTAYIVQNGTKTVIDELGKREVPNYETRCQSLKLDLPFNTYHETIVRNGGGVNLNDMSLNGQEVMAYIHYSASDIGADKRVANQEEIVKKFKGYMAEPLKDEKYSQMYPITKETALAAVDNDGKVTLYEGTDKADKVAFAPFSKELTKAAVAEEVITK